MQPDINQLGVAAESNRADNSGIWHHSQAEMISKSSSNTLSRNQTDGSWLSSPHSSTPPLQDMADDSKRLNSDNVLEQAAKENKVETATSCRLFGIELIGHPQISAAIEKTSAHAAGILNGPSDNHANNALSGSDLDRKYNISKASYVGKQEQLQVKESQSKQICSRSRTKVQMQGFAVGRAVDLAMLDGYDQLIEELEEMFDIKGQLKDRKTWEIVFTDDEGDMMLVGDDPWP